MSRLLPSLNLPGRPLPADPILLGEAAQDGGLGSYVGQITLGSCGRCGRKPTHIMVSSDSSGSVVCAGGHDPVGQRYLEAYIAVSRLVGSCKCKRCLISKVHFDHLTDRCLPPTAAQRGNLQAIRNSLAVPTNAEGRSELGRSLDAAYTLAKAHRGHDNVFVVLSDFELFDNRLADLIAFPGQVHAVVLQSEPPKELLDAESVTVTRVDPSSPPGTVARSVFQGLAAGRKDAKPIPPVQPDLAPGAFDWLAQDLA